MELLFELLLTAAATLLVALLLANLFAAATADQPRHHRAAVGPAADVIAVEEERIIEVDEVKVERAPALSEGWVEVEKAATEAAGKDLGDEAAAAPREILGSELEEDRTQQHDSGAGVAPIQVPDGAELQKQQVQPTEAAVVEESHLVTEAESPAQVIGAGLAGVQDAEAIPQELGSETVPGEVPDVVLQNQQQEEKVIEVDERELAAEVAPREVPHEVARELVSEVASRAIPDKVARELTAEVAAKEVPGEVVRELAAEVAARAIPDEVARESASVVAPRAAPDVVAMDEELKEKSAEEVVHQHEEVQTKEEAQCEANPVDQQAKPAPKEELAVPKADDLNVSQEGSSNDKAAVQLPQKEAALPGTPEDEVEFEEWEGIERSEVEKRFGAAAAFAASDAGAAALSKLDSDVQLQLQGLLKVAVDGPCYDSAQPLTLRPSSRAKWVSWQKLGNMHPEIAMGKYMDLLSEVIPRWMGDKTSSTKRHEGDVDSEGATVTMTGHTSDLQAFRG